MKRSAEMRRLDEIVAVRDLQRFAAAERAGRATAAVRDKRAEVDVCRERVRSTEECWYGLVSDGCFAPEAATSWGLAMLREEVALSGASGAVDDAEADLHERAGDWHAATTRYDKAREMRRESRRVASGRDDDAQLHEATDLALRKRGVA